MRELKVIAVFASTVNGKISLSKEDRTEWTSKEDKSYFKYLTSKIGVVIMGRKTYDAIGKALPGRLNIVLTRTPDNFEGSKNVVFTSSTPEEILEELENRGYEEVCLIGGADTFDQFANKGLVNELHITFEPIIRKGIRGLGEKLECEVQLKFKEFRELGQAGLLIYDVI
ncbi:dihydrofolate reductase family protein [Mesotoga sp. UBA6090]|uniref:dihydrofolate reductase family protein n=1 Tax=Mesotoga sp. UBA6090 TaxID=1946860 RepID=UPI0025CC2828|nr:dihydrofolate reductase family protein [Mesotoga sp. UBA6090]